MTYIIINSFLILMIIIINTYVFKLIAKKIKRFDIQFKDIDRKLSLNPSNHRVVLSHRFPKTTDNGFKASTRWINKTSNSVYCLTGIKDDKAIWVHLGTKFVQTTAKLKDN